jgi:hypothetical protein
LTKSDVDRYLLMSTTPQGSTSNQDEINLTTTNPTTTITVTEQEYIVIDDDSDCRRNEAFDLPKSKNLDLQQLLLVTVVIQQSCHRIVMEQIQ